jgi:hypothetical protein
VGQYTQENLNFPPQTSGGCVAQGTLILTPNGYVQVQNLRPGQSIEEYDFATRNPSRIGVREAR